MAEVSHILIKVSLNSLVWMGEDVDKIERFGITGIGVRNLPNSYHCFPFMSSSLFPTLQGPSDLQHRPPKVPDQTIANSSHISSDGGLDHQRQLGRLPPHEEARVT